MLHKEAVRSPILELIKSLQQKEYLKGFYVVGGTALALYYGHRHSVDIDLFSNVDFDAGNMLEFIDQDFSYQLFYTSKNTLRGSINNINVDISAHRYPYIYEPMTLENISVLSEHDIIAMKLNAIAVSGQRSKDFIDIFYASKKYTISEMLAFYKAKYDQQNTTHVMKSLIFYDEVDLADWPVLIKDPDLKWNEVKDQLEEITLHYFRKNIEDS